MIDHCADVQDLEKWVHSVHSIIVYLLMNSLKCCSETYAWKIWMICAKTELTFGNRKLAKKVSIFTPYQMQFILRSGESVPKDQYLLYLQYIAKLLEATGDLARATLPLNWVVNETPSDWKLALDLVLKEVCMKNEWHIGTK